MLIVFFYHNQASVDGDLVSGIVGESKITMVGATSVAAGNVLFLENQFFIATAVDTTTYIITLDRPFHGKADNSGDIVTADNRPLYYWTTWPTANTYEYVSECSGRGLCDGESGLCSCFKGYSNDNCDTQNTMAF
jgi:hypothetical protein